MQENAGQNASTLNLIGVEKNMQWSSAIFLTQECKDALIIRKLNIIHDINYSKEKNSITLSSEAKNASIKFSIHSWLLKKKFFPSTINKRYHELIGISKPETKTPEAFPLKSRRN